jgi:hypothetical protein
MGKRSRASRTRRQLPPATNGVPPPHSEPPHGPPAIRERLLLGAIADGELDDHLTALADAIHARHRLLHTVATATALSALCVGDQVRINTTIKPRYLHGVHGKIVDIDIGAGDGRRELTATCRHAGRRYEIALLDIDIQADPTTSRLIAAYRRWNSTF